MWNTGILLTTINGNKAFFSACADILKRVVAQWLNISLSKEGIILV